MTVLEISRIKIHFSLLSHMEPKNLPGNGEQGARWSGPLEDKAVFNGAQSLKETKSTKMPVSTKWEQKFHTPPNCLQIPDQWVKFIYSEKATKFLRNLPLTFDYSTHDQKLGEDFAKFCGLLRIYEL